MKPKNMKAVGWTAYLVKFGVPFMITVPTTTRREAIRELERITGMHIVMPREVKRCAVMPVEHSPEVPEINWERREGNDR